MAFDFNTPLGQELVSQGYAQGYTPEQIAGVLGGAMTESGFNTKAVGDDGTAYGGFQWRGDRQQALLDRASAMGLPPSDPRVQASHFYSELQGPEAKSGIADAQTPQDAATAITSALRPAGWTPDNPTGADSYPDRLKNTLMAYRALSGGGGGMMEGRSGSTGGLTPATDTDNSSINGMLAHYRGNNDSGGIPTGGLLGYFTGTGNATLGDRLTKLGAAFAVRDKPAMAQEMLNSIRANQKASTTTQPKDLGVVGDGKFRAQQKPDGTIDYVPIPQEAQDTPEAEKVATPKSADIKNLSDSSKVIYGAGQNIDTANRLQQAIIDGKFNARWDSRLGAYIDNTSGKSTENSRLIKDANALINQYVINVASQEKGPMTRAKMENARLSVLPSGAENDNATMFGAFSRIKDVQKANLGAASTAALNTIDQFPKLDGHTVGPDGKPGSLTGYIKSKGDAWDKAEQDLNARYPDFIKQHDTGQAPAAAAQGAVQVASPAEALKLPSGTRFIDPSGKIRIRP